MVVGMNEVVSSAEATIVRRFAGRVMGVHEGLGILPMSRYKIFYSSSRIGGLSLSDCTRCARDIHKMRTLFLKRWSPMLDSSIEQNDMIPV